MKRFADLMMKFLIVLSIALGLIAFIKPELIKAAIEWMREVIQLLGYWNYVIVILSSTIESFPVLGVVVPGQNILIIVG
ncbi:MAG: hypothetical protein H6767_01180 [Candidatus Peribacteria bacterium]|nr:MAG: hypothetical protein H6767_01180 [Candidatus Peribacteria bacterium]